MSSCVLRKSDIQAGYSAHGNSYGSAWLSSHRSGGVDKSIGKQQSLRTYLMLDSGLCFCVFLESLIILISLFFLIQHINGKCYND